MDSNEKITSEDDGIKPKEIETTMSPENSPASNNHELDTTGYDEYVVVN